MIFQKSSRDQQGVRTRNQRITELEKAQVFYHSVISGPNETEIEIQWLRPHELVGKPELYVDGTSRRDVIQGILGDCWLLSTCAALAKKVIFNRILLSNGLKTFMSTIHLMLE